MTSRVRRLRTLAAGPVLAGMAIAGLLVWRINAPTPRPWHLVGPVGSTSTTIPIGLEVFDCFAKEGFGIPMHLTPDAWIGEPSIDYGSHAVTITVPVEPALDTHTCGTGSEREPWTQSIRIVLREPLGDRVLLDGSSWPAESRPYP